ncbi:unnamed protein product [Phytophthora lilii]|uniref:Unnamed protein product n=1 Tax=Phytophthora lilii TaxID=2077276 RepID=A0A9W6TFH2_9STRA|nr:unnamed protein product [Phytophthora lilii]
MATDAAMAFSGCFTTSICVPAVSTAGGFCAAVREKFADSLLAKVPVSSLILKTVREALFVEVTPPTKHSKHSRPLEEFKDEETGSPQQKCKPTWKWKYPRKHRQEWSKVETKEITSLLSTLSKCHTINVQFLKEDLFDDESKCDDLKAKRSIVEHLCNLFDKEYNARPCRVPEIVSLSKNLKKCFVDLTDEVGPLFIILDDIDLGFDHTNVDDSAKQDQFVMFCESVLYPLLSVPKLFFLVIGCAPFLRRVGFRRSDEDTPQTCFDFKRPGLYCHRPDAIKKVLQNIYIKFNFDEEKTIKERYHLSSGEVTELAAFLYKRYSGHPQWLLGKLKSCEHYYKLAESFYSTINSSVPDLPDLASDFKGFADRVRLYKQPLRKMMLASTCVEDNSIDLAWEWTDKKGTTKTYDMIVTSFDIMWEDTLNSAKLHVPPIIKRVI